MTEGNQARWMAVVALTAIALYLCWRMLEPFVGVLLWAVILVIEFFSVYRRITEKTKRPSLSAFFTILFIMATVIIPLVIIASAVAGELTQLATNFQTMLESTMADPVKGEKIRRLLDLAKQYVNVEALKESIGRISQIALKGTINVVGGVVGLIVKLFFVLFTMYYLFRDGLRIAEQLPDLLPLEHDKSVQILSRTRDIISASVNGVLVIAIIQGFLGGVMFWILGVPSALLWGVLMTLLSTIPMAGAFIVWVPAAIVLGLAGHWVKALILTLWGVLVIGLADNFLRPKLVGQKTKMHELLIFFSVLGGLSVFGVLGILLGPVVLAITIALLDVLRLRQSVHASQSSE